MLRSSEGPGAMGGLLETPAPETLPAAPGSAGGCPPDVPTRSLLSGGRQAVCALFSSRKDDRVLSGVCFPLFPLRAFISFCLFMFIHGDVSSFFCVLSGSVPASPDCVRQKHVSETSGSSEPRHTLAPPPEEQSNISDHYGMQTPLAVSTETVPVRRRCNHSHCRLPYCCHVN